MWCWMVGWLACTVVLVIPVVDDPRCVGVGTFLSFCTMLNWLGSMGWPVVELCWCMGEGALKCSLILSPSVLPDSPM